jgi:hypothetical protein
VKLHATLLLSGVVAAVLFSGIFSQAYAADMTATLVSQTNSATTLFTGSKNIDIKYPAGSPLSQQLNGKHPRIEFTLNGTSSDNGMANLIALTNKALASVKSPAQVATASIHYKAVVSGGLSDALISISAQYSPTLTGFVLSKGSSASGAGDILDLQWRTFTINGPVMLKSPQNGTIDINQAIGALKAFYPDIASQLSNSQANTVLTEPVLDFNQFNTPMTNWHFLFDPVGTYGKGLLTNTAEFGGANALSVYSLGESSFREGTFVPKETQASASVGGQQLTVVSQTPAPSAQITIAGFSKIQDNGGAESAVVTAQAPEGQTSSGGFPIQVLLVFGGMMGAIAVFILFKARK